VQETCDVGVGCCAPEWPEESGGYLVADGDYCGRDGGGGEGVGDEEGVVVEFP